MGQLVLRARPCGPRERHGCLLTEDCASVGRAPTWHACLSRCDVFWAMNSPMSTRVSVALQGCGQGNDIVLVCRGWMSVVCRGAVGSPLQMKRIKMKSITLEWLCIKPQMWRYVYAYMCVYMYISIAYVPSLCSWPGCAVFSPAKTRNNFFPQPEMKFFLPLRV